MTSANARRQCRDAPAPYPDVHCSCRWIVLAHRNLAGAVHRSVASRPGFAAVGWFFIPVATLSGTLGCTWSTLWRSVAGDFGTSCAHTLRSLISQPGSTSQTASSRCFCTASPPSWLDASGKLSWRNAKIRRFATPEFAEAGTSGQLTRRQPSRPRYRVHMRRGRHFFASCGSACCCFDAARGLRTGTPST